VVEAIQRKEVASFEAIPRSVTFNPEDKIKLFEKESISEVEVNALQFFIEYSLTMHQVQNYALL
jgi:hypothetical protein